MAEKTATLREATHALYESFGCDKGIHPYVKAIGEADCIIVYLGRKPRSHERAIPRTWMGYKVETRMWQSGMAR